MILFLLLLFCTSCSNTLRIDSSIQPFVNKFQSDSTTNIKIVNLIIQFGDLQKQGFVGLCSQDNNVTPTIILDRTFWNNASDSIREQVVFHELGHCILHRQHINSMRSDNNTAPISIMHSTVFSSEQYKLYYKDYIKELFNP